MTGFHTAFLVLCTLALSSVAVDVDTAEKLQTEVGSAEAGTILHVTADLDLSSLDAPLGMSADGVCTPFRGILDGDGHVLQHLSVTAASAGLFCALEDALIANVTLDSSCTVTGNDTTDARVGAIAAAVTGGHVVLERVSSSATVKGGELTGSTGAAAGGLVGAVTGDDVVLELLHCSNAGIVSAAGTGARSAGLVGASSGARARVELRDCTNTGAVSCSPGNEGSMMPGTSSDDYNCTAAGLAIVGPGADAVLRVHGGTNRGTVTGNRTESRMQKFTAVAGLAVVDGPAGFAEVHNGANMGPVASMTVKGDASGLLHTKPSYTIRSNITNSVNAGSVKAPKVSIMGWTANKIASGIAKKAPKEAHFVVSLGEVSSDTTKNALWADAEGAADFFVLDSVGTLSNTVRVTKDANGMLMVGTTPLVDVLNTNNAFGAWTSDILPVERVVALTIISPDDKTQRLVWFVAAGSTFGDATPLRENYPCDRYDFRVEDTQKLHTCADTIDANVTITPVPHGTATQVMVTVSGAVNGSFPVAHGTPLEQVGPLASFFDSHEHVVVDAETRVPLARNTPVMRDMRVLVRRLTTVRVWVEVDAPYGNSSGADIAEDIRVAVRESDDEIYGVDVVPGEDGTFYIDLVVAEDEADNVLSRLLKCIQ